MTSEQGRKIAWSLWIGVLLIGLGLLLFVPQVHAVTACGKYADMRKNLIEQFHEHTVGLGESDNVFIEMYQSDKGETFTMMVIDQRGVACIFAAGKNWQLPAPKKGPEL